MRGDPIDQALTVKIDRKSELRQGMNGMHDGQKEHKGCKSIAFCTERGERRAISWTRASHEICESPSKGPAKGRSRNVESAIGRSEDG